MGTKTVATERSHCTTQSGCQVCWHCSIRQCSLDDMLDTAGHDTSMPMLRTHLGLQSDTWVASLDRGSTLNGVDFLFLYSERAVSEQLPCFAGV